MKTIKISKLDNLITEQHNPRIESYGYKFINNSILYLMDRPNLNIFITEKCHNKCKFCIARKDGKHEDTDIDFILDAIDLLKSSGIECEITLTGGEPTLCLDKFIRVMDKCHSVGFKCRTVSTTGYGLVKDSNALNKMRDYGFTHNINISRNDISQDGSNKVFGNEDNISVSDIAKIARYTNLNDMEMRLSCVILKGHVDTYEKLKEYCDTFARCGVENFLFRNHTGCNNSGDNEAFHSITEDIRNDLTRYKNTDKFYIDMQMEYSISYFIMNILDSKYLVKIYDSDRITHRPVNFRVKSLSIRDNTLRVGFAGDVLHRKGDNING